MKNPDTNPDQLIQTISDLVSSPEMYDAFIEQWQVVANAPAEAGEESDAKFRAIERAARGAIIALAENDDSAGGDMQITVAVEKLEEPALIVNDHGIVQDINDLAWEKYGLELSNPISDLPIDFVDEAEILTKLRETLGANSVDGAFSMLRGVERSTGVTTNILLTRIPSVSGNQLLVIVNTGEGANKSARLLANSYELTQNEHDVLVLFLKGRSLADIAGLRKRSVQTVRNQLQSIFEKTGSRSQADLTRMAFSLSSLLTNLRPVLEQSNRVNRRTVSFMRPDGRIVDATLAGARRGRLVISLPSIFGHPLTPAIEEKLSLAGIRMVCIARPGTGKTDPAPEGMSEAECVSEDIGAVLAQLREDSFILLGRASASALVFELCGLMPSRISRSIIVNAVLPGIFVEQKAVAGSWTKSLMSAAVTSSSVARLILRSGRRLMRVIGPRQFMSRLYEKSCSDVAVLTDQAVIDSIEDGVRMITAQGFEAGSRDMTRAFNDWSPLVAKCPMRVTLMQGGHDPNVPAAASRAFAEAFPDQCELIEIPGGGGLLNYSHIDAIIRELTDARSVRSETDQGIRRDSAALADN